MRLLPRPRIGHPQAGYVQLAFAAGAMILSALASKLLAKKKTNPLDGSNPTTTSTRGSYTNYVIGPQLVEPVFAWWGEREVRKEPAQSGKGLGSSSPDSDVFFESGWHILATNGPVFSLDYIDQGGITIFKGPITKDSHPSGSTVDLGHEGSFRIFWGEPNQPANTFLGNAARVGITSRWPYACYIEWNKKRLSSTAGTWPVLKYRITKHTGSTLLTATPGYIEPTESLSGPSFPIFGHVNGGEGVGYFEFNPGVDLSGELYPGLPFQLAGNSMTAGRYVIKRIDLAQIITVPEDDSDPTAIIPAVTETRTRLYPYGGVTGANNSGTVQAYVLADDGGVNPAHALAEILFEQTPQGLSLDRTYMPWSVSALEALGTLMASERFASGWVASQGGKADALISSGLLDMGVMIPFEYVNGSIDFVPIRTPTGTLPHIHDDGESGQFPEQTTVHFDPDQKDRVIFKFANRDRRFTEDTIGVDEDGRASLSNFANGDEQSIQITSEYGTASTISERRNQEVLAGNDAIVLKANHGARTLRPGMAFTADSYYDILRLTEVEMDPLSGEVTLSTIPDYFGVDASTFANNGGGGITTLQPAQNDLQFGFAEVPEVLLLGDPLTLLVLRIRAHNQVTGSNVYLSPDNTTFTFNSSETDSQAGGSLLSPLAATTGTVLSVGPQFTALGPDIGTTLDLTGDDVNWRLGRQLVVIKSSAGTEICYCKTVSHVSGSTYRLDGLIRARYDTSKLAHPAGAQIYIFSQTGAQGIQDLLLIPNNVLYLKSQPTTFAGTVTLDAISSEGGQLYGKGAKPMPLIGVRVLTPHLGAPCYGTGQNVKFRVQFRSSNEALSSGAGQQKAGTPTGPQTPRGSIVLEFLTTGDLLKHTVTLVGANEYTLLNADLITYFGSEVSFHVRARQIDAGLQTPNVTLTVTKI